MKLLAKFGYYLSSIYKLLTCIHHPLFIISIFLSKADGKVKTIRLRKPQVFMSIRSKMDCWSVKEAMLDQFYTRFGFDIAEGWQILDIGAAIGEFTIDAALKAKHGKVFAYEPFANSFDLLQMNIAQNNIENVIPAQVAVWNTCGEILLSSEIGEPLQIETGISIGDNAHSQSIVRAIDLKTALIQNVISHLDLLKLDCEGAEYPILYGAGTQTLAMIDRIVLEYHDGAGENNHQQLAAFLRKTGFIVEVVPNVVHAHLGYLYAKRVGIE